MSVLVRRLRWVAGARSTSAAIANTFVSRFAILLINFGTGVLVARMLGPEGRGHYSAMALWPVILCGLSTLGIPVALRYQVRRQSHDRAELYSTALIIGATLGTIVLVVGIVFVPHWLKQYPPEVIRFSQLMMLFAPQIMLMYISQAFFEARGEFTRSSMMLYLPPSVTLVTLFVLIAVHALNPYSVVLAYFIPSVLLTAWVMYLLRASIRIPKHFGSGSRLLFHYGLRAYGLDVLGTLSSQIDQAIVVGLLSAASFGLYAVALSISGTIRLFSGSLNTVLFPKAAGLEPKGAIELVGRSARLTLAFTVVAVPVLMLVLPFVIPLAYGKAYAADILLTRILLGEALLGTTTGVLTQAFMATGRPGFVTVLQVVGLSTALPLMLFLIPRIGLPGAAFALLGSTIVRLTLVLVSYPMVLHHPVPRLLLNVQDLRVLRKNLKAAH